MKLSIKSYNGVSINDGTNYRAYFPEGSILLQAGSEAVEVERSNNYPVYAGQILSAGYTIPLCVVMLGTISTQIDTLRALINTNSDTTVQLIATDASAVDWYLNVKPISQPSIDGQMITFLLSVSEPFWRSSTEASTAWAVTATGQTQAITNAGALYTPLKLEIKPTSAGGHGYGYSFFVKVRERAGLAWKHPLDITSAGFDTAALLKVASIHVTINDGDGITDSDTTITFDTETGAFPGAGTGMLENEQITWTAKSATQLTGVVRGVNGTTAATHANDVIIYKSLIQYNQGDAAVFVDGVEVSRWFGDWNTATTTTWINLSLQPKIEMILRTAIAGSGAITTIDVNKTTTNKALLKRMPAQGLVVIDDEIFAYTSVVPDSWTINGITRGAKNTALAAHTITDTVYWLEHDIWVYYGNLSAGTRTTDDTYKPIFELDDSSNTSWHYHQFMDFDLLRSGIWLPSVTKTTNTVDSDHPTTPYTDHDFTEADPANEMGMAIQSFMNGAIWKAENGTVVWNFYHPAGVTTVDADGEKYRYTTSWVTTATMQKSSAGSTWANAWTTAATPASAATWTAWTQASTALGASYKYLRFILSGSTTATASNANYYSVFNLILTIDSAKIPLVEKDTAAASYQLVSKLTNNTTGEYIEFEFSMALDETVIIDCETKSVTGPEGDRFDKIIKTSTRRQNWLDLKPGANTLQFDDTGTAAVTVTVKHRGRNP